MHNRLRNQLPIRLRLTLWYVLLMGITFIAFGIVLFACFQRSLLNTIDASLQIAVNQTISTFELEEDLADYQRLTFENTGGQIASNTFALRLMSPKGLVWDISGAYPEFVDVSLEAGYSTHNITGEESWRVFSQPIIDTSRTTVGWVQAAQSLETVDETLQEFRAQVL